MNKLKFSIAPVLFITILAQFYNIFKSTMKKLNFLKIFYYMQLTKIQRVKSLFVNSPNKIFKNQLQSVSESVIFIESHLSNFLEVRYV